MTYPPWDELAKGIGEYVDLSKPSRWNKKKTLVRRCDDTDEAIFPVVGKVRNRTRKVADSTIIYPGIINRHAILGYTRQVLWALARVIGRVKATFLQFDLEAAAVLENFPQFPNAHGSYSELQAAGVPLCMCYEAADWMECYAVDLGQNIVYIADKDLLVAVWKADVNDLECVDPNIPITRHNWDAIVCQRHLVATIPAWLWRAEWDTWCLTSDARRIAASEHGIEPTVDAVEGAQRVPKDRGSGVITTAPGNQHPCRCPRPKHVEVEYAHSSMERLLEKLPDEPRIPMVKPHQVRKTNMFVIDTGASSDIIGTDTAEAYYKEFIRQTTRHLEFATANSEACRLVRWHPHANSMVGRAG